MRLEFHRLIASDISTVMTYYEGVGGPKLAEEFYSELRQFFQNAANNPESLQHSRAGSQAGKSRDISLSFSLPNS